MMFQTSLQAKNDDAKWGVLAGLATFAALIGAWLFLVA